MERAVAIRKLTKLLGKKLGYRVDGGAPSSEERAAANAELQAATKWRNTLKEERDRRCNAILAADATYQSLRARHEAANKQVADLSGKTYRHKITVGVSNDLFFVVKAEGDSWEEVINKIETRKEVK
jgi:hypothetical protein